MHFRQNVPGNCTGWQNFASFAVQDVYDNSKKLYMKN
jgi:hypothetical protein